MTHRVEWRREGGFESLSRNLLLTDNKEVKNTPSLNGTLKRIHGKDINCPILAKLISR